MNLKEIIKKHTTYKFRSLVRELFDPKAQLLNLYIFLQNLDQRFKKILWKKNYSPIFIKFPLNSYEEVYNYYLMASQKFGARSIVLKTDLFNEAENYPKKGGIIGSIKAKEIYGIEINQNIKNKAEKNLYKKNTNLILGDIRKLPYEDNKFDTILDLSTIDHIDPNDLDSVFKEYARVIKNGGLLFLVVWISGNKKNVEPITKDFYLQYFFDQDLFINKLTKNFIIEKSDVIFYDDSNNKLMQFVCRENKLWPYLLTDELDYRFWLAAGFLKNKIDNKILVDLNCEHAPLLKYIPNTFKKYLGNDIRNVMPKNTDNSEFYQMTDFDFIQKISNIDILMVFGIGGYEISGELLESSTISESIKIIIERFRPEIVILECIEKYIDILKNIETFSEQFNYRTAIFLTTYPKKDKVSYLEKRTIIIIEKHR